MVREGLLSCVKVPAEILATAAFGGAHKAQEVRRRRSGAALRRIDDCLFLRFSEVCNQQLTTRGQRLLWHQEPALSRMNEIKGMGVEMLFPVRAFREFRGASHFIIDVIRLPADGITLWVTLRVIYRVRSLGLGSSFPQPLTPLAPLVA